MFLNEFQDTKFLDIGWPDKIEAKESDPKKKDELERDTYRQLKQLTAQQNDHISALKFKTKEYDKYLRICDWRKDFLDKFILSFEKLASNFGTSPFRAIGCFVGLFSIYTMIAGCKHSLGFERCSESFIKTLIPITWFGKGGSNFEFYYVIFFILSYTVIYEIIKSFRKNLRTI